MKQIFILLAVILASGGCAKLAHLQELLTLKSMSDNRGEQEKFVDRQNESYKKVLTAYQNNTLNNYPDKKSILKNFGEPLLVRKVTRGGDHLEYWLYRHPVKAFKSDKVYLYFDSTGKLVEWEYVQPPNAQAGHETQQSI